MWGAGIEGRGAGEVRGLWALGFGFYYTLCPRSFVIRYFGFCRPPTLAPLFHPPLSW